MIIGPGSKELIYSFQNLFCGNLILPNPSWVSYVPQAHFSKNKHFYVDTTNFLENLNTLLNELQGQNNYLLLNYPNNPTGEVYTRDELQAIADMARKHGVFILSDEIYSEFTFGEQRHISIAEMYPERTVITNGCSKWLGAGGWRLGFMIIPLQMQNVVKSMNRLQSETFSAVSAPIQFACIEGFSDSPDMKSYIEKSREILMVISGIFQTRLQENGFKVTKGGGAFYLMIDFEGTPRAQELKKNCQDRPLGEYAFEMMLNEAKVALLHGSAFGRPEDELSFRLSFTDFDG